MAEILVFGEGKQNMNLAEQLCATVPPARPITSSDIMNPVRIDRDEDAERVK